MAKHTPGPWTIKPGNPHTRHLPEDCLEVWGDDCGVAEVFFSVKGARNEEANAHLIAAAPELLEALELLLACQQGECGNYCAAAGDLYSGLGCAERYIEDAIAKAKGETK